MRIEVIKASVPDRDELVVELWYGDTQVAEVSRGPAGLMVELYAPFDGGTWRFELDDFVTSLLEAKRTLSPR